MVWPSLGEERSKNFERVQKWLLKYLYFKDFGNYKIGITYVLGICFDIQSCLEEAYDRVKSDKLLEILEETKLDIFLQQIVWKIHKNNKF